MEESDEAVYTLDEAFIAVGFGKFQAIVLAYAGLGSIAEAMEIMILTFVGESVKSEWNLSPTEESLITTVVFSGMLIGGYSWGLIADYYGRRTGLLSVAALTSGAGFLSSLSPNYFSLLFFRFLVGIGLGGSPVYTSWFLEFVPAPNRGIWMVIFSTFWTIGTIIEALLAWIVMPRFGWRWLLRLSSIPAFTALLFYGVTYESPRYLCMKGETTDAYNILKRVAVINQKELPSGKLVTNQVNSPDQESENDTLLPSSTKIESFASKSGFSSVLVLLSPKLLKSTILLWLVFFGNTFSYYGIILLTSELTSRSSNCGLIVSNLDNSEDNDSTYRDVFLTSLAELPGLILSALMVDRMGRKRSLEVMFMFASIFLLPLLFRQNELLTTVLLFGARMFAIGTFTVAGIYAPEIYPTSVRTTGVGVASAVGRIGGMLTPLATVALVKSCRQTLAIILFEAVIILSGLSVMFFPHETNGRELADTIAAAPSS